MKRYRQAVSALVVRPVSVCASGECRQVFELLLVHKPRKNDAWQLPQGGLKKGETLEQAAIRELKEETGLHVGPALCVSQCRYRYDFSPEFIMRHHPYNQGQNLGFALFAAAADAKVLVNPQELDHCAWVLPEQLPLYIERQQYLDVLKELWEECRPHLQIDN